ncbi:hypothetical protein DI396_06570 [Litorivita pollutaquae]|uniref:Uncharacterized protein n=1 Tax=Litorivita pollutaquae TaxID=2200892 RepID=A0A2V4MM50_9RHOB|nr:hypothetical protein [Litorivita pollutaquae]PYC47765.1 hypothetical protein DI396_06570 [Litorivita pollutaquae]
MRELDELYLEKFVDLRLKLKSSAQKEGLAAKSLVGALSVSVPFGESEAFSSERAGEVASKIVEQSGITFRQVKRTVEHIDLTLRCYRDQPIDLPLLTYVAFSRVAIDAEGRFRFDESVLPRAALSHEIAASLLSSREKSPVSIADEERAARSCIEFVRDNCHELIELPEDRYNLDPPMNNRKYYDWYKVLAGLGPTYISSHEKMLNGSHQLLE